MAAGLPVEYLFMKLNDAFDRDDDEMLTLSPKGRYLMVVMMRQFFIGVNSLRDQARAALPGDEHALVFDACEAGKKASADAVNGAPTGMPPVR